MPMEMYISPRVKSTFSNRRVNRSIQSMFPSGPLNCCLEGPTGRPSSSPPAAPCMPYGCAMPGDRTSWRPHTPPSTIDSRGTPALVKRTLGSRAALGLLAASLLFSQPSAHPGAPPQSVPRAASSAVPPSRGPQSSRLPQLVDITVSTGVHFQHLSSPEQKFIMESMSGGVALVDYDRDGWPDIYFTNAQGVEMAQSGKKARSALFHNNHDGTFTDVTDKAGVGYPCWAMGVSAGDYNNDGWPDLLVTCFNGIVLYRNNGDGTFTDVTKEAGLAGDKGWAMGATFGDYDGDGWADLFVSRDVG